MSWGLAAAGLLLAGTASAYDFDNPVDPSASLDDDAGGDYYRFPGLGTSGYLDPGYAFSVAAGYGDPGYDIGGYGLRGNGVGGYGYPGGYGLSGYGDPGYGYGLGARGYYTPSSGAPESAPAADRGYIRRLEERIRKLENANKQSLPPYGERYGTSALPPYHGEQPGNEAPAASYFGQPQFKGAGSQGDSHTDYPTYQPTYAGQPTYQFRQ
jgi:hypothetical protein